MAPENERISVIIPTRNRPQLLVQALGSVAAQTHGDCEIIVIDDGSTPAVDAAELAAAAQRPVTLLRNDFPCGQARSREMGGAVATGTFFLHLDDDDLLVPDTIARGLGAFGRHPELGVLFLNVRGFGERAPGFEIQQARALGKVLQVAGAAAPDDADVVRFGEPVFPALLKAVPMAFQRPFVRRQAWHEVTRLRREAYGEAHPLAPPLRESEWGIYAAATQRVALMMEPLYLQRCEGQGFFSIESKRAEADRNLHEIFEHLRQLARIEPLMARWRREIECALARWHFDQAYAGFQRGARWQAAEHLLQAMRLDLSGTHFKFVLRMLFPRAAAAAQSERERSTV